MAPHDDTTGENRFDLFNIYRTPFKKVGNHVIDVGILIPKDLKHGGGLVSRHCNQTSNS
jgi:hypothetical protein